MFNNIHHLDPFWALRVMLNQTTIVNQNVADSLTNFVFSFADLNMSLPLDDQLAIRTTIYTQGRELGPRELQQEVVNECT